MKTILDYFSESIDYPSDKCFNLLPFNTCWDYVGNTLLDGFINLVDEHIFCAVVDRYTHQDTILPKMRVCDPDKWGNWFEIEQTKKDMIDDFKEKKIMVAHTEIGCFRDDVVIVSSISSGAYMYFYYDMDNSDCSIARFVTQDSHEEVKDSVIQWLDVCVSKNSQYKMSEDIDNGILGYNQLPLSFLSGWAKF